MKTPLLNRGTKKMIAAANELWEKIATTEVIAGENIYKQQYGTAPTAQKLKSSKADFDVINVPWLKNWFYSLHDDLLAAQAGSGAGITINNQGGDTNVVSTR